MILDGRALFTRRGWIRLVKTGNQKNWCYPGHALLASIDSESLEGFFRKHGKYFCFSVVSDEYVYYSGSIKGVVIADDQIQD